MRKLLGVLILLTLMMAAFMPAFAQETEPETLADVLTASTEAETPEFTTLLAAIQAADASVLETLSNSEAEYTVFAPTDEAFAALGEEALNTLLAEPEQLTDLLLYHVVEGKFLAADLTDGQTLETLQGQPLTVSVEGETIFVHGAEITSADNEASNGVIHAINTVLELPEQAATAEALATTEATQAATEAAAVEGQATEVVTAEAATAEAQTTTEATQAATEEATETAVEGQAATAEVTQAATAEATAATTEATAEATTAPEGQATEVATAEGQVTPEPPGTPVPELIRAGTVADTVLQAAANAETPEFTYLLAMILASDPTVVELLSNENASVTVFAPTDAAFTELMSALGIDEFSTLVGNQEALTNLLLYHVVDGQSLSTDLVNLNGQTIPTMLAGQSLEITTDEAGTLLINGIPVLTTDVQASNGVIHVINGVLVPSEGE